MQNENSVGKDLFEVLKSAGLALGIAFLGVVVFAGILRGTVIADAWIYPVNQTLKLLSIAVGVLVFVRGEKGFLKGGVAALLFTALSYLTFSALGGDFSLGWIVVIELVLSVTAGVIFGAIAVNLKRN